MRGVSRTGAGRYRPPCRERCIFSHIGQNLLGQSAIRIKTLTAKEAKYGFGRLINLTRTEPVAVAKRGRPA
jgi:hypothetical protein